MLLFRASYWFFKRYFEEKKTSSVNFVIQFKLCYLLFFFFEMSLQWCRLKKNYSCRKLLKKTRTYIFYTLVSTYISTNISSYIAVVVNHS